VRGREGSCGWGSGPGVVPPARRRRFWGGRNSRGAGCPRSSGTSMRVWWVGLEPPIRERRGRGVCWPPPGPARPLTLPQRRQQPLPRRLRRRGGYVTREPQHRHHLAPRDGEADARRCGRGGRGAGGAAARPVGADHESHRLAALRGCVQSSALCLSGGSGAPGRGRRGGLNGEGGAAQAASRGSALKRPAAQLRQSDKRPPRKAGHAAGKRRHNSTARSAHVWVVGHHHRLREVEGGPLLIGAVLVLACAFARRQGGGVPCCLRVGPWTLPTPHLPQTGCALRCGFAASRRPLCAAYGMLNGAAAAAARAPASLIKPDLRRIALTNSAPTKLRNPPRVRYPFSLRR
jgi:hypothetical protein